MDRLIGLCSLGWVQWPDLLLEKDYTESSSRTSQTPTGIDLAGIDAHGHEHPPRSRMVFLSHEFFVASYEPFNLCLLVSFLF